MHALSHALDVPGIKRAAAVFVAAGALLLTFIAPSQAATTIATAEKECIDKGGSFETFSIIGGSSAGTSGYACEGSSPFNEAEEICTQLHGSFTSAQVGSSYLYACDNPWVGIS